MTQSMPSQQGNQGRPAIYQGMLFALIGLAFSIYNVRAIFIETFRPHPDPNFASAMAFFAEGMVPIVCALYLLAALKSALIEKLGAKTIVVMAGVLMLFLLAAWAVLDATHADTKAIVIGFLLPVLLRASSQDPETTRRDADQRVICYFAGIIIGIVLTQPLVQGGYFNAAESDPDSPMPFLPFTCVTLLAQLLQIGHVEFKTHFQRRRS